MFSTVDNKWYGRSADGKNIYKYFDTNDGTQHFVASTAGKGDARLNANQIPIDVKRVFGFDPKGR